jgi:L-iditol 2-dehydrogenase
MRAFHVTGPGELELREVESPAPGPGEVLLEIRTALTCGTDLKLLRRGHPHMPFPTPIGHEFAGVVVAVGEGAPFAVGTELMSVHTAPCGECFLCDAGQENLCDEAMRSMTLGAFADRLLLPAPVVALNAFEKPAGLPWSQAALLEPLACCVQGVQDVDVHEGSKVVIVGAGPIALMHLQLARARGAARVVVVGRRRPRLEAAEALGADVVIDQQAGTHEEVVAEVRAATQGLGADVVIECAGVPEAWEQAVDYCRRGGRVLWFGGCATGTEVRLDTGRVHYDQITALGVFHFTPRAVREARRLLVEGRLDVEPLLSGTLGLAQLPEALERIGRGEGVKYALVP